MTATKFKTATPHFKRRTVDEMNTALIILERHRDTLHTNPDDEHIDVMSDTVRELLQLRTTLSTFMQTIDAGVTVAKLDLQQLLPMR